VPACSAGRRLRESPGTGRSRWRDPDRAHLVPRA
jgi:hypothetical protein